MSKSVYFYANNNDMLLIAEMLSKQRVHIYSKSYNTFNELPAILDGPKTFYITSTNIILDAGYQNNSHIEYIPCFYLMGNLQCGSFHLNDESEKDSDIKCIFELIKKHIKHNYIISTDKMFYVGSEIYLDWLNRKYSFASLLFYQELLVDDANMNLLISNLFQAGYTVKTNYAKIKEKDVVTPDFESIVVFINAENISNTIIKRKIIRYETDSECIFIFKKNKMYSCRMDNRILSEGKSELIDLFTSIKEMYSFE